MARNGSWRYSKKGTTVMSLLAYPVTPPFFSIYPLVFRSVSRGGGA